MDKVVDTITKSNGSATAITVDGTREAEVIKLFDRAMSDDTEGAPADLFVFNMGNNAAVDFRDMTAQHFEDSWRGGRFAGFLFRREAMPRLRTPRPGTGSFTRAPGSPPGPPRLAPFTATQRGPRPPV